MVYVNPSIKQNPNIRSINRHENGLITIFKHIMDKSIISLISLLVDGHLTHKIKLNTLLYHFAWRNSMLNPQSIAISFVILWFPRYTHHVLLRYNVGKTTIITPILDGLYHQFIVILGMVYGIVLITLPSGKLT